MIAPGLTKFEDFAEAAIGQTVAERHEITREAVDAFAELSGDVNPLHMSDSFARGAGFAGRVVHGALLAAYVSKLLGTNFPGPGCFWAKQTFQWRGPVFIGDQVEIAVTVKHKSEGTRTLLLRLEAKNQDGKVVMDGEGVVTVLAQAGGSQQ